jgi:hypothetical protein
MEGVVKFFNHLKKWDFWHIYDNLQILSGIPLLRRSQKRKILLESPNLLWILSQTAPYGPLGMEDSSIPTIHIIGMVEATNL